MRLEHLGHPLRSAGMERSGAPIAPPNLLPPDRPDHHRPGRIEGASGQAGRPFLVSGTRVPAGEADGGQPSVIVMPVMLTGCCGRSFRSRGAVAIASTTSSPDVSLPKMV
jgi:hypothetical protein